ncbi:MAG: hypothetical protein EAX86_05350 [Candidatus Heimdallarchaeota archaeon]|nr:hypothetical protein [Candidatus Heimdallarchaeota archaeon]
MTFESKSHEDIIKFIYLLDKWRKHFPTEKEINALATSGENYFPIEVKQTLKTVDNLNPPGHFPLLDRIISPTQSLAIAVFIFFVFILLSSFWNMFDWADELLANPFFIFPILIFIIIAGSIMYFHRNMNHEYIDENKGQLKNFKDVADDLIQQLLPLALNGEFNPKEYPFQLIHDDYRGLRLMGRRSSGYQLMYSTPHTLMTPATKVSIMTSIGRLGFYDGLRGFQGGKPAIKIIASQIAGDFKSYLKRCADWRRIGVDILVRKAEAGLIKQTFIILDDNDVWVTDHILEEIDLSSPVNLVKLTGKNERARALDKFEKLWETSQVAEELEALSWRTYYKEKAALERKKEREAV